MIPDRRANFPHSVVINIALEIAVLDGLGPALDYMFDNSIPPQLAYRVMADPKLQRHNYERRKTLREAS